MTHGHTLLLDGAGGDDTTFVDFNGVSIINRGALGQTVAHVTFSRDDADSSVSGHTPLPPGTYFVESRWSGSEWQFRLVDANGIPKPVADLTGTGLLANWQNISQLPVVSQPGAKNPLVSRFDSHRGFVIDFAGQYRATGPSISGAVRLELLENADGVVDALSLAKHGVLSQTITGATFAIAEVNPGHSLTRGTYYVETRWNGASWQFRVIDGASSSPIQIANLDDPAGIIFTSDWQNIRKAAPATDGRRVVHTGTGLVIEFGAEYQAGEKSSGGAVELLLGVPAGMLSLTFQGGTQTQSGVGDTLRIAGDGVATGGIYQPSSTISGGGTVSFAGNQFTFTGVEPLIVHGLPDFKMKTPELAAALVIDSAKLDDVNLQTLHLHTLTVDGQVTWTQKKQFTLDNPAFDPRQVGRAIAVSDDGLTMIVGAKATPGGATTGNLAEGMVLVYQWVNDGVNSAWVEKARLQPGDLRDNVSFGGDFGASVSIDGNRLIVGAPGDAPANAPSVSFDPTSVSGNQIIFSSPPGLTEGQAVAYHKGAGNGAIGELIDGRVYFVKLVDDDANAIQLTRTLGGSDVVSLNVPTSNASPDSLSLTNYGAAYIFERSGPNAPWIEKQKLTASVPGSGRYFGASVAIRGNEILVGEPGAPGANADEAAYFFELKNGNWQVQSKKTGSGDFGRSVSLAGQFGVSHVGQSTALDSGFAVIGAPVSESAFVYQVSMTSSAVDLWTTLTATEAQAGEQFGAAVAATSQTRTDLLNGIQTTTQVNRIVVGAPLWNGPVGFTGDTSHAQQGRAFVFDLATTGWKSVARLTSDGGLPTADANTESTKGDHFGAAVALDAQYVVVGAPNHQSGQSLQVGSAYVFYELRNGSTGANSSTWTRSTGAVQTSTGTAGSGRLQAETPAAGDNFGQAVAVWNDSVSGAGRAMVGIPNLDETTQTSRQNLGAVRTFRTTGGVPDPTTAGYLLSAEILQVAGTSSMTLYDPDSRTLFVADKPNSRVYMYVNDGLYWRPASFLSGLTGFGVDMDLDSAHGRLVVGTESNYVYIFQRQANGSWSSWQTLSDAGPYGVSMGGSFGKSVAIDGDRLVVGAPTAKVKYNSTIQGFPSYSLDLELGPATTTASTSSTDPSASTSLSVGAAHLFVFNGYNWSYDRLLMPDDPNLPLTTSTFVQGQHPQNVGKIWLQMDDGGKFYGPITGATDLETKETPDTHQDADDNAVAMKIGARTSVRINDNRASGPDDLTIINDNYVDIVIFFSQHSNVFSGGNELDLSDWRDEVDDIISVSSRSPTSTPDVSTYYKFSMAGAEWGSSVDIVGTSVYVGAKGRSRTAVYDVSQYNWQADYGSWDVTTDGVPSYWYIERGTVLNPTGTLAGGFGSDVTAIGGRLYSGAPGTNTVYSYTGSGTSLSNTSNFGVPFGQPGGGFGGEHTIGQTGNRVLIGAPDANSSAGIAYLYDAVGNYLNVKLQPYRFDSGTNSTVVVNSTPPNTTAVKFGSGPSIISDGFYVVGSSNTSNVYDFRQRGPAWSTNGSDTTIPTPLSRATMGTSVAISGSTAVLGAPDYGNHGAILVFKQLPSAAPDADPVWELQAQIEAPGFQTGADFGASIAIDGDNLIVGAPGRNNGTGGAYIYRRLGGEWTLQGELTGTVAGEHAGASVDIGEEYAVAGAPGGAAVYLYRKVNGVWSFDTKLPATAQPGSNFGAAVHLDPSTLFIGAPGSSGTQGKVFIYILAPHPQNVPTGNVVPPGQSGPKTLMASNGTNGNEFGASLDGSGNFLVIGAPGAATSTGAAYVFERPSSSPDWGETILASAGAASGDRFGAAVAIDGVQIIVGAPFRKSALGDAAQGEAFSYGLKSNGSWVLETPADKHVLTGAAASAGDQVGYSVAISGDFALLGAPQNIGRPSGQGAIDTDGAGYAFVRRVTPPGNKVLPEAQTKLVSGAQTNTVAGTLLNGTLQTATLQFFDIPAVTLETNPAVVNSLTIQAGGFVAYGLQSFVATGNIVTNFAPSLKMPTDGLFKYVPSVEVQGTAPIALDLNGNGLEFVAKSPTGPKFDLDGQGAVPTAWVGPGDGWLFIDLVPGGQVSRSELSFKALVPTADSDLAALRIAFDSNHNDRLDPLDAQWSEFRIWQDVNQDGISTANEIMTLDAAGIASIGLVSDGVERTGASGAVTILGQASFVRTDGTSGIVGDAVLNTDSGAVVPGTQLQAISGDYHFIGGPGSTYVADADVDWTLFNGFLTASDGRQAVNLDGFENVVLRGGNGNNRIEVVFWDGHVTIDGGEGVDTIILHAGSQANVTVLDSGIGDELDIFGTNDRDLVQVAATTIDVFPDGSSIASLHVNYDQSAPPSIGRVRISTGAGDDDITVIGTSSPKLDLDGGEGADLYSLFSSKTTTQTHADDSGPAGPTDKIKVLLGTNGFANLSLGDVKRNNSLSPLWIENSIEEIEPLTVDPHLKLSGNGDFLLTKDAIVFNGVTTPLATVIDLTITTEGEGSRVLVDSIPTNLVAITVIGEGGAGDTLVGPDQANLWSITGPGSGQLAGSPALVFSGIENLTGKSGVDTFIFAAGGSLSGIIDGGGGVDVVDYSAHTNGVTVNLNSGAFKGVERLIGSQGEDFLIGPDTPSLWNVNGPGSGDVGGVEFSGFENLTGGSGDDDFQLGAAAIISGLIDGGAGENRIALTGTDAIDDVTIRGRTMTIGDVVTTYAHFSRLDVTPLGGLDRVRVIASEGLPAKVNIITGEDDDAITVELAAGVASTIHVDGGAPSASDSVLVNGTAGNDVISVNGLTLTSGPMVVDLTGIENLTIAAGDGNDQISLSGTTVTETVKLLGEGGDDTITLTDASTIGNIIADGGPGDDAFLVNLSEDTDTVTLGGDELTVAGKFIASYLGFETLDLETLGGADIVTVTNTHAGTTTLGTGAGDDAVTIENTAGGLDLNTGLGADTVDVRAIGAQATIDTGDDDDVLNIGSNAPGSGGVLTGIQAPLEIITGLGNDTLKVDDSGDPAASSGTLSSTSLTGLGMPSGITFDLVETLNVALGGLDDLFTIVSTPDGAALTVDAGEGADHIEIGAINGPTTINAGNGSDIVDVTPSASGPVDSTQVAPLNSSAINGLLVVNGDGAGADNDIMNFTSVFPTIEPGNLTGTRLAGLQMPDGITYSGLEELNIALDTGSGVEFTIASTHSGATSLTTGTGDDVINVRSISGATTIRTGDDSDTINVGTSAGTLGSPNASSGGSLDGIAALLTIDGQAPPSGSDVLNIDDSGDILANVGTLTSTTLTGLGMPGSIAYGAIETLNIALGSGGDTFTIESTHGGATNLFSNGGDDIVNVRAIGGRTTINGGDDSETFNVGSNAAGSVGHANNNAGGNVNSIAALLTIDGDAPSSGSDVLNVDDSGDTLANIGNLTSTTITGLGMPGSIVYGTIEELNILLGSGGDTFTTESTNANTAYAVSGGGGSDLLIVGTGDLDAVRGSVYLVGGGGNDQIQVNDGGTSKSVDYVVTPSTLTSNARPGQLPRTFAGITYDATTEFFSLAGTNAANTFDVVPSTSTRFDIDGRLPAGGSVPPRLGDFLRIDFTDVTGEDLRLTPGVQGSGIWQFTSGHKPVQFESIEKFNGIQTEAVFSDSGTGSSSDVKVFDPKSGLLRFIIPAVRLFGEGYCGGTRTATGDLNGDGIPDIAVGPDSGCEAVVKIFDGIDGHLLRVLRPYADLRNYVGGVELAIGDVNGDGWNDLVVSPGCADAIPVRVFSGAPNDSYKQLGPDLRPFDKHHTSLISVAVADQNVNGAANRGMIWFGSTVDGVATVQAFRMNAAGGYDAVPGSMFTPFGTDCRQGARVATGDVNGDGIEDVIASLGPGGLPYIQAFDGAAFGMPLGSQILSSDDLNSLDAVYINAFDTTGDGLIDFITSYESHRGITGAVSRFTPAGQADGSFTANAGGFPDLSGIWIVNGQTAKIAQVGVNLELTDELGGVTQACVSNGCLVFADGRVLAKIDGDVLRFSSGADWQRLDLTGTYVVDGKLARIAQQGDTIRIWDKDGTLSVASFSSPQTIVAANFGNLVGQLGLGRIDWSDGSVWKKLDLSNEYTVGKGNRVRVLSNGTGDLILVNRFGDTSVSHWIDPTHLVQTDWGGATGLVQDARIQWSNGAVWNKNLHINGVTGTGGSISIDMRADQILLCNRYGATSRARLLSATMIYAIDWRITGTLTGDQISWSNGVVWKDFGFNELNAVFSDIKTLPFPNILLKGNNGSGSVVSIELRQNDVFLTNKWGDVSPAKISGPNTIISLSWNITGTLKNGRIYWSNGAVWQGFDTTLLNYLFGSV